MNIEKHEETQLLEGFQQQEEHATKRIYESIVKRVHIYVYTIVKNHHDAEDITVEAFMNTYQKKKLFKDMEHLIHYLFKAARNISFNYLESNKNRGNRERNYTYTALGQKQIEPHRVKSEFDSTLHCALNQLPSRCREVARLWLDDYNYKEIAQILGITESAVRSQVSNALDKLAQIIGRILFVLAIYFFVPKSEIIPKKFWGRGQNACEHCILISCPPWIMKKQPEGVPTNSLLL